MRVHPILITLFALTNVAHALYSGKYCPQACETSINYITFNDTDPWLSKKVRACRSELRITSLYLCFDEFCQQDGELKEWIEGQRPWCEEHAGVTLPPFHDVVDGWTGDEKVGVRRIRADEALNFPHLNEFVIPNGNFFERAITTMVRLPASSRYQTA
jgi:hypothetical protein